MSVVDAAIEKYGTQFDPTVYNKLKDFEVDCIMCGWLIDINSSSSIVFVDLRKGEDWFRIEESLALSFANTEKRYLMSHVQDLSKPRCYGRFIFCMDYFRKHVL